VFLLTRVLRLSAVTAHTHTHIRRLTDLGRKQASLAGDYIRKYISKKFDRYYCSEYIRYRGSPPRVKHAVH
jgi:phosphohistidine phosphatase SixA